MPNEDKNISQKRSIKGFFNSGSAKWINKLAPMVGAIAAADDLTTSAIASHSINKNKAIDAYSIAVNEIAFSSSALFLAAIVYLYLNCCRSNNRKGTHVNWYLGIVAFSCLLSIAGGLLLYFDGKTQDTDSEDFNMFGGAFIVASKFVHPICTQKFFKQHLVTKKEAPVEIPLSDVTSTSFEDGGEKGKEESTDEENSVKESLFKFKFLSAEAIEAINSIIRREKVRSPDEEDPKPDSESRLLPKDKLFSCYSK